MQKSKNLEPLLNTVEHANAIDKGRFIPENSLDVIICDPPYFKNKKDKELNGWETESDYQKWFRIFMTIVSTKLKRTGVFYLIGEIEDLYGLFPIIREFEFQVSMTYYFSKNKKNYLNKKPKENGKTYKVIESVVVFTRNFHKEIRKLLKLKQEQTKIPSRDINTALTGNGNGGGYWSIYTGDNQRSELPTEDHWNKLKALFELEIDYNDINTLFKQYDGTNLWEDIVYEEDKSVPTDKVVVNVNRPVLLFERLILMNRKRPEDIMLWDPFCGYGNSTLACKKFGTKFYACDFDMKTYFKSTINTGNSLSVIKPIIP